jgi:hypothetical protein
MFDKLEYNKQYYAAHKEIMLKQTKEWYNNNKDHMRAYWERTREKTRERQRRWYEKNRKVITKMAKEKVIKIIEKIEPEPPKPKKPKGRPKTGRMSETEKKQRKINNDLAIIQKRADAFKMSLQCIDADQRTESSRDASTQ